MVVVLDLTCKYIFLQLEKASNSNNSEVLGFTTQPDNIIITTQINININIEFFIITHSGSLPSA